MTVLHAKLCDALYIKGRLTFYHNFVNLCQLCDKTRRESHYEKTRGECANIFLLKEDEVAISTNEY